MKELRVKEVWQLPKFAQLENAKTGIWRKICVNVEERAENQGMFH